MTILDTNVVSELMRSEALPQVVRWVDAQPGNKLFTTAITVAEIYYGIELLPSGKRRNALVAAADAVFTGRFAGRVLAFNVAAAKSYAHIMAHRRAAGRPMSQSDAEIAAIARTQDAALATHNLADFEDCGIRLIDPWLA